MVRHRLAAARTLDGSDQPMSDWNYVRVRWRTLFLEEYFYRGTEWVVFEPNDEPPWPCEAYVVKSDKETTTQDDIDNGLLNSLVGFAPV